MMGTGDVGGSCKWPMAALALAVLIGGGLRAWPIAERPLWYDEAATWQASQASVLEMARWEHHYLHPPLSFALVRGSVRLFESDAPWVLRVPSLIAGIACIPAAFGLGTVIGGRRLGAWVACLAAVDPCMVDQSQQARMYSLVVLLVLIVMAWLIRQVLADSDRRSAWGWLGLLLGLMALTHLSGLLVWLGLALGLLVLKVAPPPRRQKRPWTWRDLAGGWGAIGIAAAIAHVGLLKAATSGGGSTDITGDVAPEIGASLGRSLYEATVTLKDLINLTPLGLVVYLFAATGAWMLWRHRREAVVLLGVPALLTMISLVFVSGGHFVAPRYLAPMLPALWIGLGALVVLAPGGWRRRAATGIVVTYLALQTWQTLNIDRWWMQPDRYLIAPEIQWVEEQRKDDEIVIYHPQPLELLGRYYDLPADAAAQEAIYDANRLRQDAALPQADQAPAAWVIVGMVNHDARLSSAAQVLDVVAKRYGVSIDPTEFQDHVRLEQVTSARISSQGVTWHARRLED